MKRPGQNSEVMAKTIQIEISGDAIKRFGMKNSINEKDAVYMEKTKMIEDYLLLEDCYSYCARTKPCLVVKMTPYCKDGESELIPAEFGIVVFSIEQGIMEMKTGLLDPGYTPKGKRAEVTNAVLTNAVVYPKSHTIVGEKVCLPMAVLDAVENLAKKYGLKLNNEIMIFTTREEIGVLSSCLTWIRRKTNRQEAADFQLLSLEALIMKLSSLVTKKGDAMHAGKLVGDEDAAAQIIYNQRYDFERSLACKWHNRRTHVDKVNQCASNIVLRQAYNCLDYFCHFLNMPLAAPYYTPPTDPEEITKFYGQRQVVRVIPLETSVKVQLCWTFISKKLTGIRNPNCITPTTSTFLPDDSPTTSDSSTELYRENGTPSKIKTLSSYYDDLWPEYRFTRFESRTYRFT